MAPKRHVGCASPNQRERELERVSGEPEPVAPQFDEGRERRQHEEFMRKWREENR
jgi:hypothetical protein